MQNYIIDFESLPWQELAPGARYKSFVHGDRKIRLVEFTKEFLEPDWCEISHIGYVLEGEMEINFNGVIKRVKVGDGILIPRGTQHRHRHHSTIHPARLILVEEA